MMDCCLTQCGADLFRRDLLLVQVLLHDCVGGFSEDIHERIAVLISEFLQVLGDVYNFPASAKFFAVPDPSLHGDEVDDSAIVALGTDGELNHRNVCLQAILDGSQGSVKICTGAVHLVDEAHARNFVIISLTPHGLCLRLNSGYAVEHCNCAIKHTERTLHLYGEVNVAGSVDDLDSVLNLVERVSPKGSGCSRGDRDSTLLLLLHPVHGGSAFMDLTDLVRLTCVKQDPLSGRCFSGIDVGHDADIACSVEWKLSHRSSRGVLGRTGIRNFDTDNYNGCSKSKIRFGATGIYQR
ncbi:unannotated protein [freshwater metagenome]|uniref:Unannotated protein n=1 Tax=freshwater metagenome TaxID=449393 RepID=A0A6J6BJ54_9ZZZZ